MRTFLTLALLGCYGRVVQAVTEAICCVVDLATFVAWPLD